ncbi:leucyl aminopeptidase [Candidatus Liberibacter americanus]|uniref:Probable cytosol aminopeptidase n=1 Tax=Candidatus Liberibacter americanus str. Sao Paulo TaxID=1261131 RepID=U6B4X9_9HYPH|nr:leucyl aminopeptidase [Candidatus Liberibacter americanus]AHA27673.1 Leucyl aminopeptidase [Candidatus Liberibacter americanus str. Sao Paulo]EMS36382.1 leucyl aminopeptidase [Candidatus Liberibacter americanus PW_SP]
MEVKLAFTDIPSTESGGLAILLKTNSSDAAGLSYSNFRTVVKRAATVKNFTGEYRSSLNILTPEDCSRDRLVVLGIGDPDGDKDFSWLKEGGNAVSLLEEEKNVEIFVDLPMYSITEKQIRDFALGFMLKAYSFDKYKTTKKKSDSSVKRTGITSVTIITKIANRTKHILQDINAIVNGVNLTRDLVNEPSNVLGTDEFCDKAKQLSSLGVEVDILDKKAMEALGMNALLAVSQGSVRPPYLVIMKWNGGKESDLPLAFVGKGVVFDSGGISIKPSNSMQEMKGDMAGAAAVTGFFRVLAERKAKVNAIGILALVENMPDGSAQRPGDIVKSMSGQTVEVVNTDAEGRLIIADALWYCNDRYKPCVMIDLATLTGAIVVSLGNVYAGLFSNDDALSEQLLSAGLSTGEILWRMPMGKSYDKLIESKFADMKNVGERGAGSITAAQFLARFVQETTWAHIDIAGTATRDKSDDINQSWASGFGVRLLDEFVRSFYEK